MEGHVERRLHIGMALEAKLRLRGLQQLRLRVTVMNAVATGATDAGLGMRRAQEVGMRSRVAAQAGRIQVLRRKLAQLNDLGNVAAALYVGLARPVTALAGRARAIVPQRKLRVRVVAELLGHIGVAGGANVRTDKVGGIGSRRVLRHSRLLFCACGIEDPGPRREPRQQRDQSHIQKIRFIQPLRGEPPHRLVAHGLQLGSWFLSSMTATSFRLLKKAPIQLAKKIKRVEKHWSAEP